MDRVRSVTQINGYELDIRGLIPRSGRVLSLRISVETGSGALPASCGPEHEADHWFPVNDEFSNMHCLLPAHLCGSACISRWAQRRFDCAQVTETWSGRADTQRHAYRSLIWLRGENIVRNARRHNSWLFQESTTSSEVFLFISVTLHSKLHIKIGQDHFFPD